MDKLVHQHSRITNAEFWKAYFAKFRPAAEHASESVTLLASGPAEHPAVRGPSIQSRAPAERDATNPKP